MSANSQFSFSPQEYLEWEERQSERYEYANRKVRARVGDTIPHSAITVNFTAVLKNHVRDSGYRIFSSTAKVGSIDREIFLYPDVNVSCDPRDRTALKFVQYPCLIAEVLSPTTEAYDRGGKFAQYRKLESLKEYVLISSESVSVEVFRLNQNNKWELTPYSQGDEIELTSVDLKFSIDLLYEDINLGSEERSLTMKE